MDNIYSELLKNASSLKGSDEHFSGMDVFLGGKVKVASLGDLSSFFRISNNTLVHKAERDLWRISEDNGQIVIQRLFDPDSNPIKV